MSVCRILQADEEGFSQLCRTHTHTQVQLLEAVQWVEQVTFAVHR